MNLDKLPEYISIGAIFRNGDVIIPNSHIEINKGDELLLFTKDEDIEKAESLFL